MTPPLYVFVDNEGCLTPGKGLPYDAAQVVALREMLQRFPHLAVVLCTGRSAPYVESLAQCFGLQSAAYPCIVEGGAALFEVRLDRVTALQPGDDLARLDSLMPTTGWRAELGKLHCRSYYPDDIDDLITLSAVVEGIASGHGLNVEITTSAAAVDVTSRGVSKGAAMRHWCQLMGIDPAATVGIGDWHNDLSFLKAVGLACAPANAHPSVRAQVHYVSPQAHTAGVIDVLCGLGEGRLKLPRVP
jgi:hydroxymethylpyrimidine pyrophosphatase-like HAD family hydrolase